jgi:hypothetical protein
MVIYPAMGAIAEGHVVIYTSRTVVVLAHPVPRKVLA